MTNDERMEFLSEHPYSASRWDLVGGGKRWKVTTFFGEAFGPTFDEALDQLIVVWQGRQAEAKRTVFGRKVVMR